MEIDGIIHYVIYHVYGVKIGITKYYPSRCIEQGFEEGTYGVEELVPLSLGARFAGDREIELQIYYGYEPDSVHYADSLDRAILGGNSPLNGMNSGAIAGTGVASQLSLGTHVSQRGLTGWQTIPLERRSEIGRLGGLRTAELGKTPCQLGIAQAASASSPNHTSRSIDNPINQRHICPWCNFSSEGISIFRWHFDNCWLLKVFAANNAAIEDHYV
jgi:hypothetical protein